MNDFDWNDLRYFLAAVETRSLSGASRLMHSNQPTTGRRIDRLEQALKLKLFQRHPQGLTLTEDGQRLYQAALSMAGAANLLHRALDGESPQLAGTVRIAATEGMCTELIAPNLHRLQQLHPRLQFILNAANTSANLTRGEADIALRLYRPDTNDLVIRRIGEVSFSLYASTNYLQHQNKIRQIDDLSSHPHLGYSEGLSQLPEQAWLTKRLPKLHYVLRSDSTMSIANATAAGMGVSLLPDLIASKHPQLQSVLPNLEIPPRAVWSVIHKDLRRVERYRVTLNFLASLFDKTGHQE